MNRKAKAAQFQDERYQISVSGRHVLITDAMKDYAIEKIAKLERISDRIIDIHVTMDIQKLEHKVDLILQVNHTKIKSSASSDDMYASIDQAVDKLENQLKRYKSKLQDHHARSLSIVDMNVNVLAPAIEGEVAEINEEIEGESQKSLIDAYRPHKIVAQEVLPLKTLTYDEAVMKMELSGDAFLIFRSEDDRQLKVIYRRKDEQFGVIDLESSVARSSS